MNDGLGEKGLDCSEIGEQKYDQNPRAFGIFRKCQSYPEAWRFLFHKDCFLSPSCWVVGVVGSDHLPPQRPCLWKF